MKSIEINFRENPNKCWHKIVAEAGAESLKRDCLTKCDGYGCVNNYNDVDFCDKYTRIKTLKFVGGRE